MRYAVISGEYDRADELKKFGFLPVLTGQNADLQRPVAYHADMNCAVIGEKIYAASGQQRMISELKSLGYAPEIIDGIAPDYPNDVKLNIAIHKNTCIINPKTVSDRVYQSLKVNKFSIYEVNQGYCGCSVLFVNEKAVITGDDGIYSTLKKKFDVLKISNRGIELKGYEYGFIGGSAKLIDDGNMLFFGDVAKHTDYIKIKGFLDKYGVRCHCLGGALCDIGGIIIL